MRVAVIVGLLSVVVPLAEARACDCLPREPTIALALERADAVFEGVTSKAPTRIPARLGTTLRYEVKVLRAWKGVSVGTVLIFETEASDCGFQLNLGSSVILATVRKNGVFAAHACDPRMTIVYDHELPAARKTLDAASKPDAGK